LPRPAPIRSGKDPSGSTPPTNRARKALQQDSGACEFGRRARTRLEVACRVLDLLQEVQDVRGTSADHLAHAGRTRAPEQTALTTWAVGALISQSLRTWNILIPSPLFPPVSSPQCRCSFSVVLQPYSRSFLVQNLDLHTSNSAFPAVLPSFKPSAVQFSCRLPLHINSNDSGLDIHSVTPHDNFSHPLTHAVPISVRRRAVTYKFARVVHPLRL
jgi:hypothetical protein